MEVDPWNPHCALMRWLCCASHVRGLRGRFHPVANGSSRHARTCVGSSCGCYSRTGGCRVCHPRIGSCPYNTAAAEPRRALRATDGGISLRSSLLQRVGFKVLPEELAQAGGAGGSADTADAVSTDQGA